MARRRKDSRPTIEGAVGISLAFVQSGLDSMGWTAGPLQAPTVWALAAFLTIHGFWRSEITHEWARWLKIVFAAVILAVWAIVSWKAWQERESLLARETLPGFSSSFAVEFHVAMTNRPQYLYDFRTSDGAEVAFFLAENTGHFTMQVTDVHGETHSLDARVSESIVPLNKFVVLTTQVGVSDTATYLQIVVDGEDIAHTKIDFPLDLGAKDWVRNATFFADKNHQNSSANSVHFMGVQHSTWTKEHCVSHEKNVRKLLSDLGAK